MKNMISTKFTTLLAASAFLFACDTDEEHSLPGVYNTVIEANCSAPTSDGVESRTAVDPTDYISEELGVNWLPGDKIGVFGKTTTNACFINQSNTETASTSFAGNLQNGEIPVYAYYPYTETAGNNPTAIKGNLPLIQHYSTVTRQLEGDWKVGRPQEGSSSKFTFKYILTCLKLDINADGTDIAGEKLQSISLTIPDTQLGGDFTCNLTNYTINLTPATNASTITMELTDQPMLTTSTFHGYMSVAPVNGIYGKNMKVEIKTDRHIITFEEALKINEFKANTYYTVPLNLKRFADKWTIVPNPEAKEENADWVPGLQSHLACANTVFAIAGQPFMHKIRVPQSTSQTAHAVIPVKNGIKRAYNLPEGLTWNAERCLVEGTAPTAGDYVYSVEFTVGNTTYKEGIKLHVAATADELLSPTPMMGWQTWNVFKGNIGYDMLAKQLEGMKSKGLINAGYKYFGIDDCWQVKDQNDNGHQITDENKFPSKNGVNGMKRMSDLIHQYGLKAGIYSDCGTKTCEKHFASYGYEELHAQDYKDWGYDFLKEDWYFDLDMAPTGATKRTFKKGDITSYWNTREMAQQLYTKMGMALKERGLMLYMCEWGIHDPWKWGAETGATCWRTTYDHRDGWWGEYGKLGNYSDKNDGGIGVHNTIGLMRNLWPYVGINRYNDADMICVGIRGTGTASSDYVYNQPNGLTSDEAETSFAMWCMWSSPILLGFDMTRDMTSTELAHDLALVKNSELIAINQDALGQGAEFIKNENGIDYYQKDLANGDVAIAAVNISDKNATYNISIADFDALDKTAAYSAKDLINHLTASTQTLTASTPLTGQVVKHGTFIVRLKKQ